ncbi:MAG: S41 family peptidase [Clostridia bacterium]|nr:S41 family peptidase [Clostridia bacterium]
MKKKINLTTAIFFITAAAIISIALTYVYFTTAVKDLSVKADKYAKLDLVSQIVENKYVKDIDSRKLEDGIIMGYMYGLGDRHSAYLSKEAFSENVKSGEGKYQGIGVSVTKDDSGYIKIYNVLKNSPADKVGIKNGDIIIEVEGEDVFTLGYENASNKLLGKLGTISKFKVQRNKTELIDFEVVRQEFDIETVEYRMMENNIGFIRISQFINNTDVDFKAAVDDLKSKGAQKLIFDLRYNPGGSLEVIVNILDYLLPEGNIATIKDKNGVEKEFKSDAKCVQMPMAVIVNGSSASASELFSAALRDYRMATIVGTRTYGKGTAQETIALGDGTAIILTVDMYMPPNGTNYDGIGIMPDIPVTPENESQIDFYNLSEADDIQLQKAISALK